MDMNALLRAHQIALVGKSRATTLSRRAAYRGSIAALASRIRSMRKAGGADVDTDRFVAGESGQD